MSPQEHEALRKALDGDFTFVNSMERLAAEALVKPHYPDGEPHELADALRISLELHTGTGKLCGYVWSPTAPGECENCGGDGQVTVYGQKRDTKTDCPDCYGSGEDDDIRVTDKKESISVTTDLSGEITDEKE